MDRPRNKICSTRREREIVPRAAGCPTLTQIRWFTNRGGGPAPRGGGRAAKGTENRAAKITAAEGVRSFALYVSCSLRENF
jgi:hypothetical protein